jgi:hypothetical protein
VAIAAVTRAASGASSDSVPGGAPGAWPISNVPFAVPSLRPAAVAVPLIASSTSFASIRTSPSSSARRWLLPGSPTTRSPASRASAIVPLRRRVVSIDHAPRTVSVETTSAGTPASAKSGAVGRPASSPCVDRRPPSQRRRRSATRPSPTSSAASPSATRDGPASSATGATRRTGRRPRFASVSIMPAHPSGRRQRPTRRPVKSMPSPAAARSTTWRAKVPDALAVAVLSAT